MKKISLLFIVLVLCTSCKGKQQQEKLKVTYNEGLSYWIEADSLTFHRLPTTLRGVEDWAIFFLGTPYKASTLEQGNDFKCLINLHEFDCTTFVENVVALSSLDGLNQNDFEKCLAMLRYRSGTMRGYPSRLHYFSEWITDNEQKGFIKDITKKLGGIAVRKSLSFMSAHRESYPALQDAAFYKEIQEIEARLSKRVRYIIPKEKIKTILDKITEGDIIGFATNIKGLDFVHLGFATRDPKTNKVHLLHASSKEKAVVVSKKTLEQYVKNRSNLSGIVVLQIKKQK